MFRPAMTVLIAAGLFAGCGSGSDSGPRMVRTGVPTVEVRANGMLTTNPVPLTLDDVNQHPAGSARRAVFQQLFWMQWGSWPNAFYGYDATVRAAIGGENLTGALALLRGTLVSARPRITSSRFVRGHAAVQVQLLSKTAEPSNESFVLRRVDGRWVIIADTLLERGLKLYVTQRSDGDAAGAKPSRKAARAGIEAAARYRGLFTKIPNGD